VKLFSWVTTICNPVHGYQWIGEKWRSLVSGLPTWPRIIVSPKPGKYYCKTI
jgi:hypothetical protein